jgi:hypothetical protein
LLIVLLHEGIEELVRHHRMDDDAKQKDNTENLHSTASRTQPTTAKQLRYGVLDVNEPFQVPNETWQIGSPAMPISSIANNGA